MVINPLTLACPLPPAADDEQTSKGAIEQAALCGTDFGMEIKRVLRVLIHLLPVATLCDLSHIGDCTGLGGLLRGVR